MNNLFGCLSKKDKIIWIASLAVVAISNIIPGDPDPLTLIAAMVGVTSVIVVGSKNTVNQSKHIVICRGLVRVLEGKDNRRLDLNNYQNVEIPEVE